MVEKGLYFGGAHIFGMAFVVKEYVAALPVYIGFFGAEGVVFGAQNVTDLVEEFFLLRGGGRHGCLTFPLRSV